MMKKIIAAMIIAALTCTLFACSPASDESSSQTGSSSSSMQESSSKAESSSSVEESGTASSEDASNAAGEGVTSSAAPSSTTPAGNNADGTGANSKKYTETDENFTFKDGVYKRIYGNRAMFIVTKDPDTLDAKDLKKLAEDTAGQYYKDKYYCTVCFVKPDNADGTFDITSKKSDDRNAVIMSLHKPDSSKMTINLKERPLQEYIDKQVAKAKVSSK